MKSFNIWKKIAAGILFLNIVLTSFIGQPVAAEGTEGQPAIQRMGFPPNWPSDREASSLTAEACLS